MGCGCVWIGEAGGSGAGEGLVLMTGYPCNVCVCVQKKSDFSYLVVPILNRDTVSDYGVGTDGLVTGKRFFDCCVISKILLYVGCEYDY